MSLLIGHILCPPYTHGEQASQGFGLAFHCRQSTQEDQLQGMSSYMVLVKVARLRSVDPEVSGESMVAWSL